METVVKKLYEGLFLVDSAEAAADWDDVNATIKKILERAEAEIVSMRKWDERKLAYKIKGKARGTYIICYFRADGEKIGGIERDVQLSERIMRVLILSSDGRDERYIEKDIADQTAAEENETDKEDTAAQKDVPDEPVEPVEPTEESEESTES